MSACASNTIQAIPCSVRMVWEAGTLGTNKTTMVDQVGRFEMEKVSEDLGLLRMFQKLDVQLELSLDLGNDMSR